MATSATPIKQKMALRHIFPLHKRKVTVEPVEEKDDELPDQQEADKTIDESKELELKLEQIQKELECSDTGLVTGGGELNCLPLEQWEEQTLADPVASLARTALYSSSIRSVLFDRERHIKDGHYFSIFLSQSNSPIADQEDTERCWLFACANILRHHLKKSKRLKHSRSNGFQLSLSYLSFYDKLERANFYLERMIDLAQKPLDDRLVMGLCGDPMNDGGSWHRAVYLVRKYGIMPEGAFPESVSSSDTDTMNDLLNVKVREYGLQLRNLDTTIRNDDRFSESSDPEVQRKTEEGRLEMLRERKAQCLEEIYNILTVCMGVPPGPSDSFVWEYYKSGGSYRTWTGTPTEFRQEFVDIRSGKKKDEDPLDMIGFVNDPRHEYGMILVSKNIYEQGDQDEIAYLNVESATLQNLVIKGLRRKYPVAVTCDSNQFKSTYHGIWDPELYRYEKAFGVTFGLTKSERLQCRDSRLSHLMLFTGAHVDNEGNAVRFQVENSWGSESGKDGYYLMTSRWFDDYVYQIFVPRRVVRKDFKELLDLSERGKKYVLSQWDPIGL